MIKRIFLSVFGLVLISSLAFADLIYLKDGRKISGKIFAEKKYSVKINVKGVPYTYYVNEIEKIEKKDLINDATPESEAGGRRLLEEIPESKRELIVRLLEANGARESMNRIFLRILADAPEGTQEELKALLVPDEIILRLVPVYDAHYSDKEIQELLLFYKSPTGGKLLSTTTVIMEETMAEVANYFKDKVDAEQEKTK